MVPRHWRDLDDEAPPRESAGAPEAVAPETASPQLARLMEERQALEARMQRLTGQPSGDEQRESPRFPVTPLAERRRADSEWEQRRRRQQDAIRRRRSELDRARRGLRSDDELHDRSRRKSSDRSLTDRVARVRETVDRGGQLMERLDQRVDHGRRRVLHANARGRELERRRQLLREAGTDLPGELEQRLGRATEIISATRGRVQQGTDAWARARDRAREFGDTAAMLASRAERVLAVSVGSVDELGARMARQRAAAAARRKFERDAEQADENRRQRALERWQQKRQEGT